MKILKNVISHIILLIISLKYILSEEASPSIRAAITQQSLDLIKNNLIPSYLNDTVIPLQDINTRQHLDFIGTIKLNLTDNKLKLDKVREDQIEIELKDNSTINLNLKDLEGVIDFNYTFISGFADRKGTGNVSISEIQIVVSTRLFAHPNILEPNKLGPVLKIEKVDLVSAKIEINFNDLGNLEKLVQYVIVNTQNAFLALLKKELSGDLLTKIDQQIFNAMVNMPLYIDVPNTNLTIDYSLTESPQVIDNYLELSLNASIDSRVQGIVYEGPSNPVPRFPSGIDSIILFINEYVFQSALYTLFKQNKLDVFLNSEKIALLTTSTLGIAIPELYEHYGASKPVDVRLDAKEYPIILFNINDTKLNASFISDFIVKVNDTDSEKALTLDLKVITDFDLFMNNGIIKIILNEIKLEQIVVLESLIGDVQADMLATSLNNLIYSFKKVIETSINTELAKIKIPNIAGISFDRSSFDSHEGYIQVKVEMDSTNSIKHDSSLKFLEY